MAFDAPGPLGLSWGGFALALAGVVGLFGLAYAILLGRKGLSRRHLVVVLLALGTPVLVYTASTRDVTVSDGPGNQRPVCIMGWDRHSPIDWNDGSCGQALRDRLVLTIGPSVVVLVLLIGGASVAVRRRFVRHELVNETA